MREKMGEVPFIGMMRKRRMMVPYLRRICSASIAISLGKIPTIILPPSRG